jgi:adenine-specific DNA-methyltransferase
VTVEIWHGDSLELAHNLPNGINLVVADPPYGVDYRSRHASTPEGQKYVRDIMGDGNLEQAITLFKDVMEIVLPKCADVAELYVFTRWDIVGEWIECVRTLTKYNFAYKMLLIWSKGYPGQGDIDSCWGCGHEEILYLKRGRRDVPYRRSGIISVDKLASKQHLHSSEKPAELIEKLIEMSTDKNDLVVDPFSGSGSTCVAAQRLGRNAIGIEKDERYIEPSRRRLEQNVFAL